MFRNKIVWSVSLGILSSWLLTNDSLAVTTSQELNSKASQATPSKNVSLEKISHHNKLASTGKTGNITEEKVNSSDRKTSTEKTGNLIEEVTPQKIDSLSEIKTLPKPEEQQAENVTLNFQDVPINSLLQLITKVAKVNFVLSDKVQGKMSLDVENIPWKQALNIILKANGLGYRQDGNVYIVAPLDDLAANDVKELENKQRLANLEPLEYKIVVLKYANPKDVAELLKSQNNTLLSTRGYANYDLRTNSLLIYDTREHIGEIGSFVKKLDIPSKQVLIEARIVNIDSSFERELGARFGISNPEHLSGTLKGADTLAGGKTLSNVPLNDRLNFNMPAGTLFNGNTASVGLALARLGDVFIDLELSAMEQEGKANIVSSPRIITSNQKTAIIKQGEEIPYQEASSSGATSVSFKNAVLSLQVTPQITPDNKILLNLKVNEDKRGRQDPAASSSTTGTMNPPAIDTQQIESEILLNNGESVVVGGIYKQNQTNGVQRVPFLGNIPLIGILFSHKTWVNSKSELLLFITPTIVDQLPKDLSAKNNEVKL